jgi:FkbM family methyltransferase
MIESSRQRPRIEIKRLSRFAYYRGMQQPIKQQVLRLLGHQHWLRGRDRILRRFSHPDHQRSESFNTEFFGKSYTGNLANYIDWSVFYYGAFQLHELRLLADVADALRSWGKPINFFDVGANIGHHTLFMSSHADHVFSFEPFSVVRGEMERKLHHAGVNNATLFPVALGDRNETGVFHPPTGANQGTGTLGSSLPDNASSETCAVQVVRGDDFFAANQLPPITLLKMDVEGYEAKALAGMRETIRRDRPPIFVEIQRDHYAGHGASKGAAIQDILYPDHIVFEVGESRGHYVLKPFLQGNTEEALVLPIELAGLVKGTASS